jgi:glutamate dehydrogenase
MQAKNEEAVAHLLNDVVEFARGRLPEPAFAAVEPFLRHYYDFADADDLQSRGIADLYGAAMAHWQTAQRFVPGSERLRVYNPILEQHGWHSDHTVIEIVNDDMPFLVDSVSMAVNRLGLSLHSVLHPVFRIWRGKDGGIERIAPGGASSDDGQSQLASFIHFEVDRCGDAAKLDALRNEIAKVLGDVRAAVEDWPKIVEIARTTIRDMAARETSPEGVEARAFVEWMVADHFTFLGQRDYELVTHNGQYGLRGVPGSGFGILRESLRPQGASEVTRCRPPPPISSRARRPSF